MHYYSKNIQGQNIIFTSPSLLKMSPRYTCQTGDDDKTNSYYYIITTNKKAVSCCNYHGNNGGYSPKI